MKQAPGKWFPKGTQQVYYNGSPAYSFHFRDLDEYATWLACVEKIAHPWIPGNYYAAADRYELIVRVPQFTAHVGWEVYATGRGTITISNDDAAESYDVDLGVYAGAGTSGSHDIENMQKFALAAAKTGASGNGEDRAIDVTFSKEPIWVTFTIDITDASGSSSLRVYSWRPIFVALTEEDDLSTAA